jgi:putative transcriptional regulator
MPPACDDRREERHHEVMDNLRGHLLIAGANIFDPNFRRTVILVAEHDDNGAVGVILNRPAETTVREAVPLLAPLVPLDEKVYVGGPVEPNAAVVLADFSDPTDQAQQVMGSVGFLRAEVETDIVERIDRARVFAGYAGWAPGQLEGELAGSDWIIEPAQPDDVFSDDPEELWSAVLKRKGGKFHLLASMPLDPTTN